MLVYLGSEAGDGGHVLTSSLDVVIVWFEIGGSSFNDNLQSKHNIREKSRKDVFTDLEENIETSTFKSITNISVLSSTTSQV